MTDTPQLPDDVLHFLRTAAQERSFGGWVEVARILIDKYAPPEPEWLPGDVIFYSKTVWIRDPKGYWLRPSRVDIDGGYSDLNIQHWDDAIVLVKRGKPRIDPNAPIYMRSFKVGSS